jgi:hypothetical protein
MEESIRMIELGQACQAAGAERATVDWMGREAFQLDDMPVHHPCDNPAASRTELAD